MFLWSEKFQRVGKLENYESSAGNFKIAGTGVFHDTNKIVLNWITENKFAR